MGIIKVTQNPLLQLGYYVHCTPVSGLRSIPVTSICGGHKMRWGTSMITFSTHLKAKHSPLLKLHPTVGFMMFSTRASAEKLLWTQV